MKFTALLGLGLATVTNAQVGAIAYDGARYTGTAKPFSYEGTFNVGFTANSVSFRIATGTGCCLRLCNGRSAVGNRICFSPYDNPDTGGFNKVVIGCTFTPNC